MTSPTLNVLYLGNVGRAQLLATAIRAAALAKERGVPVRLRFVGSGPQWDAAHLIAEETRAPVEFYERVPTHQVLPHYEWADTVLVCLRNWELFQDTVPSKLYEIMLSGRHITASVAGETAELIAEHEAGDVAPPEDVEALVDLWSALAADRGRLTTSGMARAWVEQELSVDKLATSFAEVLEGVVADAGRAR